MAPHHRVAPRHYTTTMETDLAQSMQDLSINQEECRIDNLMKLPSDIIATMFQFMQLEDLSRLGRSSRLLNSLVSSNPHGARLSMLNWQLTMDISTG